MNPIYILRCPNCKNHTRVLPYLDVQYHRLAACWPKKAKVVAGQNLLVNIYHDLGDQQPYHELGGNYRDVHNRQATERRLIRRLEKLGSEEVSSKSAPLLPEQDFSEDEPTITYREMDAEVRTPLQVLQKAVPVRLHSCRPRHLFLLFRPL